MSAPTPPSAPPPGWSPPPLGWTPPPQGWAAPAPGSPQAPAGWAPPGGSPAPVGGFPPPVAPGQPAPQPRRPSRLVVTVAVAALVLVAGLAALWALGGGTGSTPQPSPGVPTAPVGVEGGDIGRAVPLSGPDGEGTVTVNAAVWTPEGELDPEPGMSYLIVDVEVTGTAGDLEVGGMFTVAVADDGSRHSVSFGPELIPALPSARLDKGESVAGQVGFQVPVGETRIEFQDPAGTVLGSVTVPAP